MRYVPVRRYLTMTVPAPAGAGPANVQEEFFPGESGMLVGVTVRFDDGNNVAGQEFDQVTVKVYDTKTVDAEGALTDGAILFDSSPAVDNITDSATSAFVNETFNTPLARQPYRDGYTIGITATANFAKANPHFYQICVQTLVEVPG
jgi:hypothetical protein